MDLRAILFALVVLVTIVTSTENGNKLKADANEADESSAIFDSENLDSDSNDLEKRRMLFRYGKRGSIFRYGRGGLFRYGKRGGTLFRYGKRDDDVAESSKRLFRWGKRADTPTEGDLKRLFRWGKRSDEYDVDPFYADAKRQVFRYGKRDDLDEKRHVFRYGKRDEILDEDAERYGRDTRAKPHVPFRFGEE